MDFALTEEQAAFQATAREFARDRLAPEAGQWDETRTFPAEALRAAAALGFAAIYVDEAVGGAGLSRLDAALIFEELAAADPSTAAFLSIHNMVAWMVGRFGNAEQHARVLPRAPHLRGFLQLLPDGTRRGQRRRGVAHARRGRWATAPTA